MNKNKIVDFGTKEMMRTFFDVNPDSSERKIEHLQEEIYPGVCFLIDGGADGHNLIEYGVEQLNEVNSTTLNNIKGYFVKYNKSKIIYSRKKEIVRLTALVTYQGIEVLRHMFFTKEIGAKHRYYSNIEKEVRSKLKIKTSTSIFQYDFVDDEYLKERSKTKKRLNDYVDKIVLENIGYNISIKDDLPPGKADRLFFMENCSKEFILLSDENKKKIKEMEAIKRAWEYPNH